MSLVKAPVAFDADLFRAQFPLFAQPENARLVYLDNAATTQKPQVVIDAVSHFYLHENANAHRASHRLARAATAMHEQVREKTARWINAKSCDEIVFCRGATEGLNLLAFSLTQSLRAGDEIILSVAEHHANLVPWQMAAKRLGLTLKFLPLLNGSLDLAQLPSLITAATRIVALTAASNALGFSVDVAAVAPLLESRDIVFVVDAAQAMAHDVVDVQRWGCDFLVASAHKFYGPSGIGFVYGRRERWQVLPPWQGGGEMIEAVTLEGATFAQPPHRFEAGTSALAATAGLGAAIDFLSAQPRAAMRQHEVALTQQLHQRLQQLPWLQVLSVAENNVGTNNVGVVAFRPQVTSQLSQNDIAVWLDGCDVAVRGGTHCAQPLIQLLGGPWLRASLAAYNTQADIDRLIDALVAMPLPGAGSHAAAAVVATPAMQSMAGPQFDDLADLSLAPLYAIKGWQARYGLLLEWGGLLTAKPQIRTDVNRVSGCEAAVWMQHQRVGGVHRFAIDTDSRVIRGLAVLLLLLIDQRNDDELAQLDLSAVFSELDLARHLSPSRVNGFRALVDQALQQAGVKTG